MRRWLCCAGTVSALILSLCVCAAARELIPGGSTVGLQLDTQGVMIAETTEACRAELMGGDRILRVDDTPVTSAAQVQNRIAAAEGAQVVLHLERNGKAMQLLAPLTREGKLGVLVKDQMAGIGTVTYVDPHTGHFGCLGHGVSESGSGALLPVSGGQVLPSQVVSVDKGKSGTPGRLNGAALSMIPIGKVDKNTAQGVFGILSQWDAQPVLSTADVSEIVAGPAVIRCCVAGAGVQEYDVEILELYPVQNESGRDLLLRVTDPDLLNATGGIVQGMSGSPILQNGRIVGAVTHVLINDPTKGYGIFIENMLEAAENGVN